MDPVRTVSEHQSVVAALVPATPVNDLPLAEALGLVLAADVSAPIALPPFDNSAMDGYAVRAADVASASESEPVALSVAEDIPAGRTDVVELSPGTAHRIMTGAPMPPGADAIVKVEDTDGGTETVRITRPSPAGTHLRKAGEDAPAGAIALRAGTVLGPAQLGLAAAVGAATVPVRRRPNVLVLSTGTELVAPGEPLRYGQIYESNGTMLAAAVRDAGGCPDLLRFVPDDVPTFLRVLRERIGNGGIDLVVTSGGVSAGAYEVVKDALADRGVEFVKVGMQPGGPQGAGRASGLSDRGDVAVVTLPGNPVSSLVSFEVFVRPVLRAAMGLPQPGRAIIRATLGEQLTSPPGRRQFRRGEYNPATGVARTIGGPGSHLLSALALSNCLIDLPAGTDGEPRRHATGTEVDVWLME
jgi:molybdopterin molybdotransferase